MVRRMLPFLLALCGSLLLAAPALASFELSTFSVAAENQDGSPNVQAGSHPYALTTSFTLHENPFPEELENSPKDIQVDLPPGFFGDPQATPRCNYSAFREVKCAPDTIVGSEVTYTENRDWDQPIPLGWLCLQCGTVAGGRGRVRILYKGSPCSNIVERIGSYRRGLWADSKGAQHHRGHSGRGIDCDAMGCALRCEWEWLSASTTVVDEPDLVRCAAYRDDQHGLVGRPGEVYFDEFADAGNHGLRQTGFQPYAHGNTRRDRGEHSDGTGCGFACPAGRDTESCRVGGGDGEEHDCRVARGSTGEPQCRRWVVGVL